VLKQTFRSIGALIGLTPVEFLTDAERTRTESLEMLLRKAEGMGANGVLGLQFQASEGPDGATRVLAFGEAVLLFEHGLLFALETAVEAAGGFSFADVHDQLGTQCDADFASFRFVSRRPKVTHAPGKNPDAVFGVCWLLQHSKHACAA